MAHFSIFNVLVFFSCTLTCFFSSIITPHFSLYAHKIYSSTSHSYPFLFVMLQILNRAQFEAARASRNFLVVHFAAEWCAPCKQLNTELESWVKCQRFPLVTFATIDGEVNEDVSTAMNIHTVPHVVFFRKGKYVCDVQGANIPEIESTVHRVYQCPDADQPLEERLKNLIHRSPVMIFLTGTPSQPRCGFTARVCEVLNRTGVPYDSFDIMSDSEVLDGLKTYSNWPTYPQLYVKGELIGGCDIILELDRNGTLEATLKGDTA